MANPIRPEPGLVIRYDFLFESDQRRGQDNGKERPVVVVITIPGRQEGDKNVIVSPITHTPPSSL